MLASAAYGQTPTYTPMRSFYEFKGIKMDSLFVLPVFTDTTAANAARTKYIAGSVINAGNNLWMRNVTSTAWLSIGKADSPDRINGTSFNNVYSDFNGSLWEIQNVGGLTMTDVDANHLLSNYADTLILGRLDGTRESIQFVNNDGTYFSGRKHEINSEYIFLNNATFTGSGNQMLYVNNSGQVGITEMPLPYPSYSASINLSGSDYSFTNWGTYSIVTGNDANAYQLNLPSPANFGGLYITIFNKSTEAAFFNDVLLPLVDASTDAIDRIQPGKSLTLYSDGAYWRSTFKNF